jgi:hypothetical protein
MKALLAVEHFVLRVPGLRRLGQALCWRVLIAARKTGQPSTPRS